MTTASERYLFPNEVVRATELSRTYQDVLNKAAKEPVAISWNEETFALMRLEIATSWWKQATYALRITEIVWNALAQVHKKPAQLEWISTFDAEDREEMSNDVMEAYRKATRDGSWNKLEATIREWSDSGWAEMNPEIRAAYAAAAVLASE